jgi:hypothetical protein
MFLLLAVCGVRIGRGIGQNEMPQALKQVKLFLEAVGRVRVHPRTLDRVSDVRVDPLNYLFASFHATRT